MPLEDVIHDQQDQDRCTAANQVQRPHQDSRDPEGCYKAPNFSMLTKREFVSPMLEFARFTLDLTVLYSQSLS